MSLTRKIVFKLVATQILLLLAISFGGISSAENKQQLSDDNIRQILIDKSIHSYQTYSGDCPCPYNTAKDGSRCGGRSAYSRAPVDPAPVEPGALAPISLFCYESDITQQMLWDYRNCEVKETYRGREILWC